MQNLIVSLCAFYYLHMVEKMTDISLYEQNNAFALHTKSSFPEVFSITRLYLLMSEWLSHQHLGLKKVHIFCQVMLHFIDKLSQFF